MIYVGTSCYPLPIPPIPGRATTVDQPVRVEGRLRSTRGGRLAWWRAGKAIPLSAAPYEPKVAMVFDPPVQIEPLGRQSSEYLQGFEPDNPVWLAWGSTSGSSVLIRAAGVTDLTRRAEREALFAALRSPRTLTWAHLTQGRLTAAQLAPGAVPAGAQELMIAPARGFATIANHAIMPDDGGSGCSIRVAGLDFERLVQVEGGAVVASPDHLLEPLRLGHGWWYLYHPEPRAD
ncbi:MAG TPA: hypothetical protein VNK50_13025 [Calidithermus sp.]|nr:hypothetical protein [Calidithermus sp.]